MDIVVKAVETLKTHLSEDELVELSELLDGDPGNPILEKLDEHLMVVRPDLFVTPAELEKVVSALETKDKQNV
jgi:hypothetical protein